MASAKPKFRRRAEARPDEILDAALHVFTRHGFDAARMDDIAAAANISKGAVYLYFDGKEALLRGLIEREVAPVAAHVSALAEAGGDDPKATIARVIETAAAMTDSPRMMATPRLVLSVAPRFAEIAEHYRRRVVDIAIGAIAALHRRGVATGVFRDVDSDAVARMVMGPILVFAMRRHILGASDASEPAARASAHVDILFEGLLRK